MIIDMNMLSTLACPVPITDYPNVLLAHGGGGRLTQALIERMFLRSFANPALDALHDGARLEVGDARLAFSTDSFVISPLFFPGGDIGSLAVHGTVNDLAMCGARPIALSAGFILEEGFSMEHLWRIVQSMQHAAAAVDVPIVTGDTKVVDRGKADGLFITTTGLGVIGAGVDISPRRAQPGDVILISGTIADHGIAIMSVRNGLEFETTLESDSAPLHDLVACILAVAGADIHVLRDPTRGGVASALNEIAAQSRSGIRLDERALPIKVRGACEFLGLDPLYVANEGKCLAVVSPDAASDVLAAMRSHPLGQDTTMIGEVVTEHRGQVFMRSRIGGLRVVDMLSGEQLPRIC
jgi:hydrogenase expression/formation protein HypE